jgi:hypothetical protein
MRPRWRPLLALLVACSAGCAWLRPTIVRVSPEPDAPLFESNHMFGVGGAPLDGALCSLLTLGPDATRVVSPPEATLDAVSLEEACQGPPEGTFGRRGRTAQLVEVQTTLGPMHGYLYTTRPASGLLVAFSGLGMPPAGWINERLAELGAGRGLVTFAPVRDEIARPIEFDPLREALRALEAAGQVAAACHIDPPATVFAGISLGGLEALLANREALAHGRSTRAAVLDPLLDVELAAAHLDASRPSLALDAIQAYFRRLLAGRYGEREPISFRAVLSRTGSGPGARTDLRKDAPSAWLCQARHDAYVIFLSDLDPALGEAQRRFATACGFPLRRARAPGHAPLACRLEIFDEMLDALWPPP